MVATDLHPKEVIVPVLGRDAPDAELRLLGTGSIIGDGSVLLTANHVAACVELSSLLCRTIVWRLNLIRKNQKRCGPSRLSNATLAMIWCCFASTGINPTIH